MKRITGISLAVLLLLAGCGGSEGGLGGGPNEGGGEDEPGSKPVPPGTLVVETQGSVWRAYRDGDGAWQVLQDAEARHVLPIENADGRYAVAHVCLDDAETVSASLLYATAAARPEVLSPCASGSEDAAETFYTLTGTLSGLAAGETGRVHSGAQVDSVEGDGTYSLAGLTEGTYDLLAAVYADLSTPPREVLLVEEVSVTGDATLDLTLDLTLSKAVPTTLKTLTVEGASAGDEVGSSVTLVTKRNTRTELGILEASAAGTASYDYAALPNVPEGTRYHLSVESVSDRRADGGDLLTRSLERILAEPADLSLRLPPALEASAELVGGRPQITWRSYTADSGAADYTAEYRATFENLSEEDETRYAVSLTEAWLGDSAYTLPDFSDLPGWNDAWNLPSELFWSLSARLERGGERVSSSRSGRVSSAD